MFVLQLNIGFKFNTATIRFIDDFSHPHFLDSSSLYQYWPRWMGTKTMKKFCEYFSPSEHRKKTGCHRLVSTIYMKVHLRCSRSIAELSEEGHGTTGHYEVYLLSQWTQGPTSVVF